MATAATDDLFPDARNPEGTIAINERCLVRTQSGHRVVIASGVVLSSFALDDVMSEAFAMVNLVEQGWADQNDVARAFNCSPRTVRRYQRRFQDGGMAALDQGRGFPQGRSRQPPARRQWIHRLKSQGHSNREIARRLGVNERAIRKALRRMGWKEPNGQAGLLPEEAPSPTVSTSASPGAAAPGSPGPSSAESADPKLSAFSISTPTVSADTDPSHRSADRLLARLGLLHDAPPLFGSGANLPRAGVLLAVPALVRTGVFACAQQVYDSLGAAFYGLRTSLLTLLLMALWRIKRPEALKEHCPQDLGRVLGLDRAPEVKTLRRKLSQLAAAQRAAQFGRVLAQHRVAERSNALGFLYVDGHVRVYHGQHRLPKAHVAQMRLSMPATSD
jgi:DNA-binding CsgD family transcriptional regulator